MFMDDVGFINHLYDNDDIMPCNWDKPASRDHVGSLFYIHYHIYCGKCVKKKAFVCAYKCFQIVAMLHKKYAQSIFTKIYMTIVA